MSGLSPATVLFSSDGTELAVVPSSPVPANTRGILVDGYDGTNARMMLVDSFGRQVVIGAGTAGSQAGGLLTIQGDPAGTPVPVSGTVTAVQTTAANLNALVAQGAAGTLAQSWFTRISDGTNGPVAVKPPSTPAVATDSALVVAISPNNTIVTSNASVSPTGAAPPADASYVGALVNTAAPSGYTNGDMYPFSLTTGGLLRMDGVYPTAAVAGGDAMYVGGAVTTAAPSYTTGRMNPLSLDTLGNLRTLANQGAPAPLSSAWPVELTDGYGNLFGEANNPLYITATVGGVFNNSSVSVVGGSAPTFVTYMGALASTSAPTELNGDVYALSLTTSGLLRIDGVYPVNAATPTSDATFVAGAVTTAAPAYTTGQMSALSLDTTGNLRTLANQPNASNLNATVVGSGSAGTPATGVVTIQGITGGTAIPVSGSLTVDKSTTGTVTSVNGATSNTVVLTSNANRVNATLYNNTNKNMYVKLGTGASTSSFTTLLMKGDFWEVTGDYTGEIDAVWDSGVSGAVLVTELT